ncbi:hypothetical protein DB88DRAFT_471237 [Papiliotrema laurentii]|uniref:Uncharacterized protein n=1 Tax=Papiliotrema laurentii TaxID=5418 RepID=A0AAD9FV24_PAPLA|nr:hypothetical protein DB88DRAFT_471237 [Papiliotrema laurentii]
MAQSILGWKGLAPFDNDGTRSEFARSIEHFDTFEQASHWFQQSSRRGALSKRDTLTLISMPTYVALLNGQVSLDRFVVKDLENEGYTCDQLSTQDGENRYQLKCTDGGDVNKDRKSLKTVGPPEPPQSDEELYFYRVSPAKWLHHRSPFRNLLPYKDRHSADTFIRDPDAVLKAVTQCGLDYFLPEHFDHSSRANDPEYALARSPMPQGPGSRCGSHPNVQILDPTGQTKPGAPCRHFHPRRRGRTDIYLEMRASRADLQPKAPPLSDKLPYLLFQACSELLHTGIHWGP